MLVYILIFLVYLSVGATIERRRYAIANFKYQQFQPSQAFYEQQRREAEHNQLAIKHGICNMKYSALANRGCDCEKSKKWWEYKRIIDLATAQNLNHPLPEISKSNIMGWPLYVVCEWVKSGEPPMTDEVRRMKEINSARQDAEIAELRLRESLALDRELELSRRTA